jgi:hypothetical protein
MWAARDVEVIAGIVFGAHQRYNLVPEERLP